MSSADRTKYISYAALAFFFTLYIGCGSKNSSITAALPTIAAPSPHTNRLSNGIYEIARLTPSKAIRLMGHLRSNRVNQRPFASGYPTPTPGPTINADNAWISANNVYDEQFVFATTDTKCTSVSINVTTTIPNLSPLRNFSVPPNSTYTVSLYQAVTGNTPPGIYSETVKGICNDGYSATTTVTVAMVHVDWVDGATNKVVTGKTFTPIVGQQLHLILQTKPNTELELPVLFPTDSIWYNDDRGKYEYSITGYTQTHQLGRPIDWKWPADFLRRDFTFYYIFQHEPSDYSGQRFYMTILVPGKLEGDEYEDYSGADTLGEVYFLPFAPTASLASSTGKIIVQPNPLFSGSPYAISLGYPPKTNCAPSSPAPGIKFSYAASRPTPQPAFSGMTWTPIPAPSMTGQLNAIQLITIQGQGVPLPEVASLF